jgi:poly-gamma-glutamate synthesis protein (capsule biosynthesis protein)
MPAPPASNWPVPAARGYGRDRMTRAPRSGTILTALGAALLLAGPARAEPRRVTIAATGDVLLHKAVVGSARAHAAEGGWGRTLAGLAAAIDDGEIGVVNMETPLTEAVVPPRSGHHPVLGAPPEVAQALAAAGVTLASVANNHAYDQRSEGLGATVEALRAAGVAPVGAGETPAAAFDPRVLSKGGLDVAFLATTGPLNQRPRLKSRTHHAACHLGAGEATLIERVARARADGADLVVVLLHWMWDYRDAPGDYEHGLAARLIDAGADVILGAGPHLLHPVERVPSPRGEAVVAWSLGNLVSGMGMRWRPGYSPQRDVDPVSELAELRDGAVLHLEAEVGADGRVRFPSLRATPLWTENNWRERHGEGFVHDIRVVPLADAPEQIRALRLPAIAAALGPEVVVRP